MIIVVRKRSLGLRARTNWGQVVVALLSRPTHTTRWGPRSSFPFPTRRGCYRRLFLLFATLVIVGTANAANFTDGLDGLATGSSAIA